MCGIFGIDGCDDAANLTYLGLYALQHRGQESAGIVSWDGAQLHQERGMGHVSDIFKEKVIARLPGSRALGHTRYSTAGSSVVANAQPIARVNVVEPLGSGRKEATRLGRVEMWLEAPHRLKIGERYRVIYQDVEGKFHETVFTIPAAAKFDVGFLGTKLKEEIPLSAYDLAAIVTPVGP